MNTRRIYQFLAGLVIILGGSSALAQDAADADYSAELKRIPPTEPAEALQTFEVIAGYKLEQVAAEPLVTSPVAASFDEDGRLFVVEMRDYSEQDKEKLGRIRLLTDTDGNGVFDKSEIFAEGLSWPTAVITYNGGIFVGAAPDIWYLKDADHDGRADEQRVVFTGFGRGNVQGLLNSFTWGLDNRIHVAVSSAGAELQRVDTAGKPTGKPLTLRGRDFSFDPRNPDDFIATSGGGQHGMSFDDWGRKFVSSNSDHIQLIMLEDADLARNPYLVAPNPRISIALDGPQADVFRISPVEPWREVRTRLRVKGLVPGPVEGGGRAAGYFTGATGVTIYRGNAWPKEDRGLAIVGDVGSNLIHRKRLIPHGLELRAKRIDEKREFVASRDNWFRPVQFLNAPDGALYVLDMYRETIEHPASLPPAIKKHLDLTSGRDRGRIYRIVPDNFQQPPLPKLSTATTAELVALLEHENGWHRDTAARLIYEATDRAAIPALHKLALASERPLARLHALQALRGLDASIGNEITSFMQSNSIELQCIAIRLAAKVDPQQLSRDSLSLLRHPQLRLALALAQGDLKQRSLKDMPPIPSDDLHDPWIRAAVLSSVAERPGELMASRFLQFNESSPQHDAFILLLADQMIRLDDPEDFKPVLQRLPSIARTRPDTFRAIASRLKPAADSRLGNALRETREGKQIQEEMKPFLSTAWTTLENDRADVRQRIESLQIIHLEDKVDSLPRLMKQFDPSQPTELQSAVLDTALSIDSIIAGRNLLAAWPKLSPAMRTVAGERLVSRRMLTELLLRDIKAAKFSPAQLSADERQRLLQHPDPSVRNEAAKILTASVGGSRVELAESYRDSLKLPGDKTRGAEHFKKQCSACHKLGDVGKEIGPNLAAMKNRGAEAIMVNVLDPNREVNPQFVTYAVITKDGRTLSGMIAAETATSLTLRRGEGQEDTVLRIDIEELRSTGLSLMPEGLEKQLDQQQLADVIAFILAQ